MTARRNLLAVGVAASTLVVGGTIAVSAGPEASASRYGTAALPDDLTKDQQEAVVAVQTDGPIPVQDATGSPRGFVRDSALTARDERVVARIHEVFPDSKGLSEEQYDVLFEALRILDPVAVTDADGTTVGYWTHDFKEIDELEKLTPEAQATVDRLLR